jgi:hypothetical protein
MTIDQIRALLPNAPTEFILQAIQAKVSDPTQLLQYWQLYQLQNPTNPPAPDMPQLPGGWLAIINLLFNGGSFATILAVAVKVLRMKNPVLGEAVERIYAIVRQWEQTKDQHA